MMYLSEFPAVSILLLSFLGVLLPFLVKQETKPFRFLVMIAPAILLTFSIALYAQGVRMGRFVLLSFFDGLELALRIDSLSMLFIIIIGVLWFFTSMYAIGYLEGKGARSQQRFFSFFSLSAFAAFGVAVSDNFLTLYVFYEALSLSTIPLVMHQGDAAASRGGIRYIAYLLGASIAFALPALIIAYSQSDSLQFQAGGIFSNSVSLETLMLVALLSFFGFAKAAIFPLHSWLPGAMVAPTPVSALLHAVAVVKVGIFSHMRVVTGIIGVDVFTSLTLFSYPLWVLLVSMAALAIIYSSMTALGADGLKRRLAFSTISQLNYLLANLYLLLPLGLLASFSHMFVHAFSKIVLFFCAGAIYVHTGKTNVSDLRGLGRKMPLTFACFAVCSLAICGLPPGAGFWTKFLMLRASFASEHYILLAALCFSALCSAYYLLVIPFLAFLEKEPGAVDTTYGEAPLMCLIPIVLVSIVVVLTFLFPEPLFVLCEQIVREIS